MGGSSDTDFPAGPRRRLGFSGAQPGTERVKKYDKRHLQLRRVDLQMNHHAAFLFWNVKGALAESWAHGPDFGAYSHGPDELQVKPPTQSPEDRVLVAGLKNCGLWSERPGQTIEDVTSVAREWLSDCLTTLRPSLVTRFALTAFWSYPVSDRDLPKVRSALDGLCGARPFDTTGFTEGEGGVTAALRGKDERGFAKFATLILGVYGSEQAGMYFNRRRPDEEVGVGLQCQVEWRREEGFEDAQETMKRFTDESFAWSRSQIMPTIAAVVNSSHA